ncbi:MAG: hypothetical protein V3R95_01615 [Dehalococcoidia bacterium]
MQIELLWFDDCPSHGLARELLSELMTERGIEAQIEAVNVADVAISERVRFPGSPTIRIDGVDVEPDYFDSGDYTPRCRLYVTAEGLRGVPQREWVADALDRALASAGAGAR